MKSFRVPIIGLMGLVLFCAVSLAAFRSLSSDAANLAFAAMWTAVLAGVIASRYGRHRAFWNGFWIVGGGYAMLAFAPGAATEVRPYLVTSLLLEEVAARLELPKLAAWYRFGTMRTGTTRGIASTRLAAFPALGGLDLGERYERIGHSVAAIVHGVGGGVLATVLSARGRRRAQEAD